MTHAWQYEPILDAVNSGSSWQGWGADLVRADLCLSRSCTWQLSHEDREHLARHYIARLLGKRSLSIALLLGVYPGDDGTFLNGTQIAQRYGCAKSTVSEGKTAIGTLVEQMAQRAPQRMPDGNRIQTTQLSEAVTEYAGKEALAKAWPPFAELRKKVMPLFKLPTDEGLRKITEVTLDLKDAADLSSEQRAGMAAWVSTWIGTAHLELGERTEARRHYRAALRRLQQLPHLNEQGFSDVAVHHANLLHVEIREVEAIHEELEAAPAEDRKTGTALRNKLGRAVRTMVMLADAAVMCPAQSEIPIRNALHSYFLAATCERWDDDRLRKRLAWAVSLYFDHDLAIYNILAACRHDSYLKHERLALVHDAIRMVVEQALATRALCIANHHDTDSKKSLLKTTILSGAKACRTLAFLLKPNPILHIHKTLRAA